MIFVLKTLIEYFKERNNMSAFSRSYELNGEDDSVSLDDIYEFVEQNINADEIYTSLLIKNYEGKNIEVKITDIEKDKWYNKKLTESSRMLTELKTSLS
jgi:hypothetical protein